MVLYVDHFGDKFDVVPCGCKAKEILIFSNEKIFRKALINKADEILEASILCTSKGDFDHKFLCRSCGEYLSYEKRSL